MPPLSLKFSPICLPSIVAHDSRRHRSGSSFPADIVTVKKNPQTIPLTGTHRFPTANGKAHGKALLCFFSPVKKRLQAAEHAVPTGRDYPAEPDRSGPQTVPLRWCRSSPSPIHKEGDIRPEYGIPLSIQIRKKDASLPPCTTAHPPVRLPSVSPLCLRLSAFHRANV